MTKRVKIRLFWVHPAHRSPEGYSLITHLLQFQCPAKGSRHIIGIIRHFFCV